MIISEIITESILDEFSMTNHQIQKTLEKKGYKYIGKGVDQSAYIEPGTGYILKIFGTQGSKDFSKDHKMFFKWAKFCMRHQDNPFLPRFYGYESFMFGGHRYLQIRTEHLFKNPDTQRAVALLSEFDYTEKFRLNDQRVLKLAKKLGPDKFKLLYETLKILHKKGKKKHYWWDLHADNVMVRKNGTPVINDPWVVGIYS
jgi:hypothetical protein